MAPRKKTHGVGAVISTLIKFLHPSALIREKFPNLEHGQRLPGCMTVRQEVKKINRKDQLSLIVTHPDFKDAEGNLQELHAMKKHFTIEVEGDSDLFFDGQLAIQPEQPPDTLLPSAIDADLIGENHGGTADLHRIYSQLCRALSMTMMTMNRHQRTYQQHQRLPPSSPMNGDIQVFVFAGKTALQILQPNSSSLSTQPGMTSTYNCLSAFSPRSLWRT